MFRGQVAPAWPFDLYQALSSGYPVNQCALCQWGPGYPSGQGPQCLLSKDSTLVTPLGHGPRPAVTLGDSWMCHCCLKQASPGAGCSGAGDHTLTGDARRPTAGQAAAWMPVWGPLLPADEKALLCGWL